jgi:hypothetical protein
MNGRRADHSLYRQAPLKYSVRLPVLGVPTEFRCTARKALEIVERTYGSWRAAPSDDAPGSAASAVVRLIVHQGASRSQPLAPFQHLVPDPTRLLVVAPDSFGVADRQRGDAVAYVSRKRLEAGTDLVDGLLEALTLFLLSASDREPLHAAGIVRDGTAILLAGPSGTGKSTLCYAACRRGYGILGDDAAYVQMQPRLRIWGRPGTIRLPTDAGRHFAELRGAAATRMANGKTKIAVEVPEGQRVRSVERATICWLERGNQPSPRLERVPAEWLAETMAARLEPGFDLFAATLRARVHRLAAGGGFRLRLGRTPDQAVSLLEETASILA